MSAGGDNPEARIRVAAPSFDREVEESVLATLRSGHVAQGPRVAQLEQLCAEMAGTRDAVAVCSGTAALEAALEVVAVGDGDEVITSPFTFAATINAVLRAGATVRFADIGEDFTVNHESMAALCGPRTRVLLPVHLYGLMADMDAVSTLASTRGLAVVEDAAQAHGATQGSRRAGGTGLGCFSFYATKNVTAAEGGVITTSDAGAAERLRVLRNQGMGRQYQYLMVGRNLRLTDLAAAVAIPQMRRLDEINGRRRANADFLSAAISPATGVRLPQVPAGRTHVFHQYTVLLPEGCDREVVVSRMAARGVDCGVYYPRLAWDHDCYRTHPRVRQDATPVAAAAAARCLSLPVHQRLTQTDLGRVADSLNAALSA